MSAGGIREGHGDDAITSLANRGIGRRVYHRLESSTQKPADARLQETSGELWGAPSRWSNIPSVKAYDGPLPRGGRGIEFTTPVPPDPNSSAPGKPSWYYPQTAGVKLNAQGYAVIPITVLKNTQVP